MKEFGPRGGVPGAPLRSANGTYVIFLSKHNNVTALFTKPPAEPFPALPGTIPVEQKNVNWLSMGAAGRNDLLRYGGFVNMLFILMAYYFQSSVYN